MQFTTIATEQTTAVTDAILGVIALIGVGWFQCYRQRDYVRVRCWQSLLLFAAIAAFLGTVAHGIVMDKATYEGLWKPLLLILGYVVASIVLIAAYDVWGASHLRWIAPLLGTIALLFFATTFIQGLSFLVFIAYEAVGMLTALVLYIRLAVKKCLRGAGIIAVGIVLQLVAAGAQAAGPYEIRMIWLFDHNGVFHIVGIVATLVMLYGGARGFEIGEPPVVKHTNQGNDT